MLPEPLSTPASIRRPRRLLSLAIAGTIACAAALAPGVASADPPSNDSFENPRTVPPSQGGSNSSYTAQAGEPAHAGVAANHSRWFRYTNATAKNLTVQLDTCGSDTDTVLSAYESAPDFASLVSLAEDDDSGAGDPGCTPGDSKISFTATPGTSYLFALDSKVAASPGSYLFTVKPQPPNADFADAIAIAGTQGSRTESNFFGGAEAGEPAHAGQPASNSAWYSFTPVGNGTVTVDACNSLIDTVVAVYTGTAVNALTPVASNDDTTGCGSSDTASRVEFAAVPGQTFMIAVDGKTAAVQGRFTIDVEGPPPNDLFAGASDLGSTVAQEDGTSSTHAGFESGEPAILGDPAEHSVWYRWTAPQSGPVRIDTCSSNFDTVLGVYTGSSIGTLNEVAANDDSTVLPACQDGDSLISFVATEGEEYRIAIDGKAGASGSAHLTLVAAPLNDDFADATQLNGTADFGTGFTTLATGEAGEPQHGGVGSGSSLWYSWTAPIGGIVDLTTCSSAEVDPVLAVYTGAAVNALTQVAASNDAGGTNCSPEDGAISFGATAGTTYRIAVDSVSGAGRVEVSLVRPADTTPPDTSITTGPSGTITTSEAAFTYDAAPDFDVASFECSVDGSAFAPCPATGRSLSGLAEGAHAFAVRAVDFDGNADATPASRQFTVAFPVDCSTAEAKLAKAKAKLKKAKAKVKDADGRSAVAKAKAKVKKAKAKVKKAKAALAACDRG